MRPGDGPVLETGNGVANRFHHGSKSLLLDAPFLAALQVIVYAGAIMVLFLFVIMLVRPEALGELSHGSRLQAGFAWLLGTPDNVSWRIAPGDAPTRVTRRYWPGTLILETLFETATGSVALIDFMAVEKASVIRIVEGRGGSVRCGSSYASASNTAARCPG